MKRDADTLAEKFAGYFAPAAEVCARRRAGGRLIGARVRSESAQRVSGCLTALLREQPFFGSLPVRGRCGPRDPGERRAGDPLFAALDREDRRPRHRDCDRTHGAGSRAHPWVQIPNLGSHILAIIRRKLSEDWHAHDNLTPMLCETFVQVPRYTGTLYKASGWINVGTTKGRGRYDRTTKPTNRKRTSGSVRSEMTGKERSTSENHPTPERLPRIAVKRHPVCD